MRRLSRVWKLYIVYTALLSVVLAAGGFLLQTRFEDRLVAQCSENGFAMACLVSEVLSAGDLSPEDIPLFCQRLGGSAGIRVSILDEHGRLQGDSSDKVTIGESRVGRPEIDAAMSEGFGHAVRRSESVGVEMCYVALKVEGTGGIVRIGIPMQSATRLKNDVAVLFALVLYLAPVLIIGAVFFVARKLASSGG